MLAVQFQVGVRTVLVPAFTSDSTLRFLTVSLLRLSFFFSFLSILQSPVRKGALFSHLFDAQLIIVEHLLIDEQPF